MTGQPALMTQTVHDDKTHMPKLDLTAAVRVRSNGGALAKQSCKGR